MSDSLPQPEPENADKTANVPAENVPNSPLAPTQSEEIEAPADPDALAADRAGFKFLAIGFAFFFAIIAICASIVALVMKSMGI